MVMSRSTHTSAGRRRCFIFVAKTTQQNHPSRDGEKEGSVIVRLGAWLLLPVV